MRPSGLEGAGYMTGEQGTAESLGAWPKRELFGVPLAAMTLADVVRVAEEAIRNRRRLLVGVVNAAKLVSMRRDPSLRSAVLRADPILADGMSVVWASRILGRRVPERVAGIDLMHALLRSGDQKGYRVYFLGATDEVLEAAVARIRSEYPGLSLAGSHNGYFGPEEEPDVVAAIREARPDLLFVAMSPPKKELFLAKWADELGSTVLHGVGGALDVVAGKTQRAPARWQRWGLEWLYRVKQEPRRLWRRYLVTNTLFFLMVVRELFHRPEPVRGGR